MAFLTGYVLGITRGHNGSVCLLYNGDIVFHIEEERLTKQKYDGAPYASIKKVLEYTDKIDYAVIAHTQSIKEITGVVDYTGEDPYTALLRKFGLIERVPEIEQLDGSMGHPQVIDLSGIHHKLHAAAAFYRSGFQDATALIIDGAGTFAMIEAGLFDPHNQPSNNMTYETETIITCAYPAKFETLYKHSGVRDPMLDAAFPIDGPVNPYVDDRESEKYTQVLTDKAGIVKCYEGITNFIGFQEIEAGKTMGLAPYGKPTEELKDDWFIERKQVEDDKVLVSDRNIFAPSYPNSTFFDHLYYPSMREQAADGQHPAELDSRKDAAWKIQYETEKAAIWYIRKAYEMTGNKNIVISGGYGLNCVANYKYLEELKDLDLNIYVEPISSDAGTCIGAAMMFYRHQMLNEDVSPSSRLYLGPKYDYDVDEIKDKYTIDPTIEITEDAKYEDVVDLLVNKNIVAIFQGRSESGPRALGNRSLIFDPRFKDGKDFVNTVKNREWFRPFAGSILLEDAPEWFDMKGLEESPDMMYAMDCQPGVAEKIPSIIHVDGTCRIQTVKEEDNYHYYNLIKAFKEKEGCPIVFNTSFNLGGDPLVETLDDAIGTLQKSSIEYLYLPEYSLLMKVENTKILK